MSNENDCQPVDLTEQVLNLNLAVANHYPSSKTFMPFREKLKCRKVSSILRYFTPIKIGYAYHLLILFYSFQTETSLRTDNIFTKKLAAPYVIDMVNRKRLVIKTYCELPDEALGMYKNEMINNDERIEEPFFSFDNDVLDGISTKNEGIYCMNQRSVINFEITFPLFQDDEKAMKEIDL